jgi:hypothetical protein
LYIRDENIRAIIDNQSSSSLLYQATKGTC